MVVDSDYYCDKHKNRHPAFKEHSPNILKIKERLESANVKQARDTSGTQAKCAFCAYKIGYADATKENGDRIRAKLRTIDCKFKDIKHRLDEEGVEQVKLCIKEVGGYVLELEQIMTAVDERLCRIENSS